MDPRSDPAASERAKRPAELGLWDAVSVIVGIVVGVSIFKCRRPSSATSTRRGRGSASGALAGWSRSSARSATANWPRRIPVPAAITSICPAPTVRWRAFCSLGLGSPPFSPATSPPWRTCSRTMRCACLTAIRAAVWFAAGAVIACTLFNVMGLKSGKSLQNLLSVAKVLGLAAAAGNRTVEGQRDFVAGQPTRRRTGDRFGDDPGPVRVRRLERRRPW